MALICGATLRCTGGFDITMMQNRITGPYTRYVTFVGRVFNKGCFGKSQSDYATLLKGLEGAAGEGAGLLHFPLL